MAAPITPAPTTATSQSGTIFPQPAYHLTQPEVLPSKDIEGLKGTIEGICARGNSLFFAVFGPDVRVRGLLLEWSEEHSMEINRAAFGALAVFGVVAAGGGAYLANRHNDAAIQPAPLYPAPAMSAVTETENSIATPPAAAVEPAPLVAAEPAPAPSRPVNVARRAPAPAPA